MGVSNACAFWGLTDLSSEYGAQDAATTGPNIPPEASLTTADAATDAPTPEAGEAETGIDAPADAPPEADAYVPNGPCLVTGTSADAGPDEEMVTASHNANEPKLTDPESWWACSAGSGIALTNKLAQEQDLETANNDGANSAFNITWSNDAIYLDVTVSDPAAVPAYDTSCYGTTTTANCNNGVEFFLCGGPPTDYVPDGCVDFSVDATGATFQSQEPDGGRGSGLPPGVVASVTQGNGEKLFTVHALVSAAALGLTRFTSQSKLSLNFGMSNYETPSERYYEARFSISGRTCLTSEQMGTTGAFECSPIDSSDPLDATPPPRDYIPIRWAQLNLQD